MNFDIHAEQERCIKELGEAIDTRDRLKRELDDSKRDIAKKIVQGWQFDVPNSILAEISGLTSRRIRQICEEASYTATDPQLRDLLK